MSYNVKLILLVVVIISAVLSFKYYTGGWVKISPEEKRKIQKYEIHKRKHDLTVKSLRESCKDIDELYFAFLEYLDKTDNPCVLSLKEAVQGLPNDRAVVIIMRNIMDNAAYYEQHISEGKKVTSAFQDINPDCKESVNLVFEKNSKGEYLLVKVDNFNMFYECVCSLEAENEYPPVVISSKSIDIEDFKRKFITYGGDSFYLPILIKHGYLTDNYDCVKTHQIKPREHFSFTELKSILQGDVSKEMLLRLTSYVYRLAPQPNMEQESFNYDTTRIHARMAFDSLETGIWNFYCSEITLFTGQLLNELRPDITNMTLSVDVTISLDDDFTDTLGHILNAVSFSKDEQLYCASIDAFNGIIGPIKLSSGELFTLNELEDMYQTADYRDAGLLYLDDSVLLKKRELLDEPYPCNFLPDLPCTYTLARPESGYQYERLSYSDTGYFWFHRKMIDEPEYVKILCRKLREINLIKI